VGFIASLTGVLTVMPLYSSAATATVTLVNHTSADVFITEVQTGTSSSGSEEFVELYNNSSSDIDLADAAHAGKDAWKLQYFSGTKFDAVRTSATASGWSSPSGSIALTGTIGAHDYYVLAGITSAGDYSPGSLEADQNYSPHLSDNTALQLIDTTSSTVTTYHDRLLWSSDSTKQGGPTNVLAAPKAGSSLQRVPFTDGTYLDETGVLASFTEDTAISPKDAWAPAPVVPTDPGTDGGAGSSDPTSSDTDTPTPPVNSNDGLLAPVITELLPNPASPASDDQDEFIELHNANDTDFNLKGYTLETGTTTLHDFTFTSDTLLPPQSYQVFTSALTGLSLSNSGGQARLIDTTGKTVSQTAPYQTADDGLTWAFDEASNSWQWSTTPTPAATNVITAVQAATTTTTNTKSATPTTAKVAKAKTVKVAGVKSTKAKAVKKTTKKTKKPKAATVVAQNTATQSQLTTPIHPWTLAIVAALTVAYGLYEYRYDLANRLYQFRKHRANRSRARYALQGR